MRRYLEGSKSKRKRLGFEIPIVSDRIDETTGKRVVKFARTERTRRVRYYAKSTTK